MYKNITFRVCTSYTSCYVLNINLINILNKLREKDRINFGKLNYSYDQIYEIYQIFDLIRFMNEKLIRSLLYKFVNFYYWKYLNTFFPIVKNY